MNAFSNTNIKDKLCGGCDCSGFAAALGFVYSSGAKTITFTDNTVYGSGDPRKLVQITIFDAYGAKISGSIAAGGAGSTVISTATLDASGGFTVKATVLSVGGCISDGHVDFVGLNVSTGNLGYWDKDNNNINVGSVESLS
jgi:hypothetical protein